MKKLLLSTFVVIFSMSFLLSCDDAHNTTTSYYDGLFTVWGESVIPELQDTAFVVGDMSGIGLETGDKALMRVSCLIDNVFGPKYAEWQVDKVYEEIDVNALAALSSSDSTLYTSPILGIGGYYTYGAAWAWRGCQMLNVVYNSKGIAAPQFVMSVDGVEKDTLRLSLSARIEDGNETRSKLLCYDLATAKQFINEKSLVEIGSYDSIYTTVSMLYQDIENDTILIGTIIGGKLVNPF